MAEEISSSLVAALGTLDYLVPLTLGLEHGDGSGETQPSDVINAGKQC